MKELIKKIDEKRADMIELANKYGITSKAVLDCSQELDQLILACQKIKCNPLKTK